jgi:hypothetical protein
MNNHLLFGVSARAGARNARFRGSCAGQGAAALDEHPEEGHGAPPM